MTLRDSIESMFIYLIIFYLTAQFIIKKRDMFVLLSNLVTIFVVILSMADKICDRVYHKQTRRQHIRLFIIKSNY